MNGFPNQTFRRLHRTAAKSALCEFTTLLISRLQRMAGLTGRSAARRSMGEWRVRAGRARSARKGERRSDVRLRPASTAFKLSPPSSGGLQLILAKKIRLTAESLSDKLLEGGFLRLQNSLYSYHLKCNLFCFN